MTDGLTSLLPSAAILGISGMVAFFLTVGRDGASESLVRTGCPHEARLESL